MRTIHVIMHKPENGIHNQSLTANMKLQTKALKPEACRVQVLL